MQEAEKKLSHKTDAVSETKSQRYVERKRGSRHKVFREQDEFDQRMIDLARVTRVMAGGKRMRFRACMVIGDRNGRVGWGVAKGSDVAMAMQKAVAQAKKNILTVSIIEGTIPHEVSVKFKAARLMLRPAKSGRGLIAGGVVRTVLELAGVKDIVSKIIGSNNKINNVSAVFKALASLRRVEQNVKKTEASAVPIEINKKPSQRKNKA